MHPKLQTGREVKSRVCVLEVPSLIVGDVFVSEKKGWTRAKEVVEVLLVVIGAVFVVERLFDLE